MELPPGPDYDGVVTVIKRLTPHLRGLSLHPRQGYGFNLRHLLPAAAQLEQITGIEHKFLSCLGHFHMLKVLHIDVRQRHQHSTLLTHPCLVFTH